MKYLMVCFGNICRSPLAEGILKKKLKEIGRDSIVNSRGFEPYHNGDSADLRARKVAEKHGINISQHRAVLFKPSDFDEYDLIFVMDNYNYSDVVSMARDENDLKKIELIMNVSRIGQNVIVPDPYYVGEKGFEEVFDMLSEASDAIIDKYEKY